MKPTGDKIAKGSCKSSQQIYCIDGGWSDACAEQNPPTLFGFGATGMS